MLRRLRAILVTAGIWAAAWLPVGVLFGMYLALPRNHVVIIEDAQVASQSTPVWGVVWRLAFVCAVWGAVTGILFSLGVLVAERRHRLHEISSWRFAVLGGAAAGLLPVYILIYMMSDEFNPGPWFVGGVLAIVLYGAGTAVAMLRAAQRA
jgi:hypothetical protein